jgi:hypothetical protein
MVTSLEGKRYQRYRYPDMVMTGDPSAEVSQEHTTTDAAIWLYQCADVVWDIPCCLMFEECTGVHLHAPTPHDRCLKPR